MWHGTSAWVAAVSAQHTCDERAMAFWLVAGCAAACLAKIGTDATSTSHWLLSLYLLDALLFACSNAKHTNNTMFCVLGGNVTYLLVPRSHGD